ncbi:cardiolipin synthase [Clostridium polynesiense]|uniref:cardiolipin synthase n=1 Tax=Clostridium polynesiense TaxID=1325933 RepID=UPI00058D5E84|nr:cardiolipin synthase [Clostridium polynesiense]
MNFVLYTLYAIFVINIILAISIVILEKKQPERTIAWLMVLILLPPIGLILYIFLGRNWKIHKLNDRMSEDVERLITPIIEKMPKKDKPYIPLIELLANNSDSPVFINNEIKIFIDGNEKYRFLKEELLKAKHHIHLEYYIFKNDGIGNEIKDILVQKVKEGVKVRFIIDKVGSIKVPRKYLKEMAEAGIDVVVYSYFLAPLLRAINTQINFRNHRKIVVIDGKVGFLGGINIGDEYLGLSKMGYWRDTHIMVKGDFTLGLQAVFLDDFLTIKKVTNSNYVFYDQEFDKYFPAAPAAKKKIPMQLVKSGPDSQFPAIMQATLKMISIATDHIYITTPYFVPSEGIMDVLQIAALGGVDVRIIFPEQADHFTVNYASRTYLADLLRCGAKVYFYDKKSFVHSKTMTIDGKMCSVGTANLDRRSFELNYEINSVIYDEEITQELEQIFFEDLKKCRLFTLEEYESSGKFQKILEGITRIFSALL